MRVRIIRCRLQAYQGCRGDGISINPSHTLRNPHGNPHTHGSPEAYIYTLRCAARADSVGLLTLLISVAVAITASLSSAHLMQVRSFSAKQRTVKDLGIHIDNSLKFSSHINQIVAKAHARASLIHKCFLSKDQSALINAYTTYVRPLLQYSVCVWSPYHLEDIIKIESVQRRLTKRIRGLSNVVYKDRLEILSLESLHQDLIYS